MAKKTDRPARDAGPKTTPEPLSIERRVRRAFSSQARASVNLADFTNDELEAFAELVTPEGAMAIDIATKFAEIYRAHRTRVKQATLAAKAKAEAKPETPGTQA